MGFKELWSYWFLKPPAQQVVVEVLPSVSFWQETAKDEVDSTPCLSCHHPGVRAVHLLSHSYSVCGDDICLREIADRQVRDVLDENPEQKIQPFFDY